MTDREKLVEAMARGMFPFWFSDEAKRLHSKDATVPSLQLQCKGYATAALAAIEASGAVIMIPAGPYAKETRA
jgi:hypothetical protein